jgi:hypothetical protein
MASTKALSTIIAAATSNAAAATTTGAVIDLTVKYSALLTIKITNGATAPTLPANAYVYVSGDNVNFKLFQKIGGDTVNASVNEWAVDVPVATMYVRVDVKDNTAQAVTCEAFAQTLVTI